MEPSGIPWSIVGPVSTIFGALIGIGVGWGAMKSIVASLKLEVMAFKHLGADLKTDITTLKANESHSSSNLRNLSDRVNTLEQKVSALSEKTRNL